MFKKHGLNCGDLARLALICCLPLAACNGKKDGLVIFDVQTAADVSTFTQYRFSVPGNTSVPTEHVAVTPANLSGFRLGYYMAISGSVMVLGQAVRDDGCVVGQGTATASGIVPGHVTQATPLPIAALATPFCPPDGGAGSGGDGGGAGGSGGEFDARADVLDASAVGGIGGGFDAPTDLSDASATGGGGQDGRADGPVDTSGIDLPVDSPPPTSGSILWARSASTAFLTGVAEGPTGVVVTGTITAPADLGGGLVTPAGQVETIIAQYAVTDGSYLLSSKFGGGSPAGTSSVNGSLGTLDFSGNPMIAGVMTCDPSGTPVCNKIDVGRGSVDPGGGSGTDGFVGRYSVATGVAGWTTRLVGPGNDNLISVANGPNNGIFLAGWFDQSTSLISGTNTRMFIGGGDRDILVAQLNASTGEIGMSKTFAGPAFEQPTAIAWTGTNIIVAGFFAGTTVFGAQPQMTLTSVSFDIWVAELSPTDGTPVWVVPLSSPGDDKYPSIVLDSAGNIYLTATLGAATTLGTYGVGGAGGTDVLVAKLRGADGAVLWATSFGSAGDDGVGHIAINSSGQLIVSANIAGPISPGGPWAGSYDAALLSYNADGTRLWTKVIGTSGTDIGLVVAAGTNAFYATVNLGADIGTSVEGVPILGAAEPTGLVLKIEP